MELVLPNNYVAIEQEEMMYLDGEGWLALLCGGVGGVASGIAGAITGAAAGAATGYMSGYITGYNFGRILESNLGWD
ncbi:Uncharacterised protein [Streptococcus pseudopneumoniae]|nr:Uncharacterised protein [Streptococcus pseudopneumoniae]CJZ17031.1 Uncharacterised protein [Streptococcus pseudopneumoniae]COD29089.1 Uncharacterised protein [Streptococcus pseudopneumoniae]COO27372.1 Uncharacterised protein [Streptococcus pseudopneumoniae]